MSGSDTVRASGIALTRLPWLFREHGILLAGIAWLALEYCALGPFSGFMILDTGDSNLPALSAYAPYFWQNQHWFPFALAGTDRHATGMFGGLDAFLFWLLPDWIASAILSAAPILFGGVFAYLLVRRSLDLRHETATIAGLTFAIFCSTGQIYMTSLQLLPFLIWSIERGLAADQGRIRRWLWLILGPALFAKVTHIQILVPFPLIVAAAWFLCLGPRRSLRDWAKIALALALIIALRAQDIIALVGLADWGHRTAWTGLDQDPFHARLQATILRSLGDGEPTTVLLLLGAVAWALLRPRPRQLKAITALLLLVLGLIALIDLAREMLRDVWPVFRLYRFRLHVMFPFVAVMFGAFGIEALIRLAARHARSLCYVVIAFLAALFLLSVPRKMYNVRSWVEHGSYFQVLHNPIIRDFARTHPLGNNPYRIEGFQLFQVQFQAYGLETLGGYFPFYGRRFYDYGERLSAGLDNGDAGARAVMAKFRRRGSRATMHANARRPQHRLGEFYSLDLLSLANTRYIFSRDPLTDERLVELRRAARPWNSMSMREKAIASFNANFTGLRDIYIYENPRALPRFFVVNAVRPFRDAPTLLSALTDASIEQLAAAAWVVEKDLPQPPQGMQSGPSRVEILDYKPDQVRLRIEASHAGILVGTNSFSPWWHCVSNGANCRIFPAYHAFWGVVIDKGTSEIEFRYRPPYARWLE
jgi:hypothetical protein